MTEVSADRRSGFWPGDAAQTPCSSDALFWAVLLSPEGSGGRDHLAWGALGEGVPEEVTVEEGATATPGTAADPVVYVGRARPPSVKLRLCFFLTTHRRVLEFHGVPW